MAVEKEAAAGVVQCLRGRLVDERTSLAEKYRILFSLRNIAGPEAESAILEGLRDESALFRHEVAYCLGQRQDPAAIQVLTGILMDGREHPMVRHEAGEALGAIGTEECLQILNEFAHDACLEVAQTCQLALQRIGYYAENSSSTPDESRFWSVDPAPALPASTPLAELRALLLQEGAPIFQRYRALFALRNAGNADAVAALGAAFKGRSALLKHEVAYVLGQMQDAEAVEVLRRVLEDKRENAMVRHEAAEALGSIAGEGCEALLQQYTTDAEPIVADSCIVALDMLAHERSGEFQYAAEVAACS